MKINIFQLILVSTFAVGCGSKTPPPTTLPSAEMIINIDVPDIDKFLEFDKITPSVESIIPLESTEESLFGNASKIGLADNKLYVLDMGARILNIFDSRNGKFLGKIKADRSNDIRDFKILGDTITLLTFNSIKKYSTKDYSFLKHYLFKDRQLKKDNPANFVYYSDSFFYIWSKKSLKNPKSTSFIKKYENGKNTGNFVSHELGYNPSEIDKFNNSYTGETYTSPALNILDIYKIDRDSISILASLKFKKPITLDYLKKLGGDQSSGRFAYKNDFFKDVRNIIKLNTDLIYFECNGPASFKYHGVFSVKTKKLVDFGKNDFIHSPTPFFADGKYLYAYYEPQEYNRILSEGNPKNFFHRNLINRTINTSSENNLLLVKLKLNEIY